MPLPNPKVLIAFVQLYLTSRQKGRKPSNPVEQTFTLINNTFHYLAGKPSDDVMVQTCQGLMNKFANKDTAEKWIEVVLDVCDTAKKAQESKTSVLAQAGLTNPESLLCETLYAIRSYILFHLQTDPALVTIYNKFVRDLLSEYERTQQKITTIREEYNDASEFIKKRAELVTKLAYLDHRPSVHLAIDLGCLNYLPQVNSTPGNMPYCYLEKFYLRMYSEKYQLETRISFQEFEIKAITAEVAPAPLPTPALSSSPVNAPHAALFTPLALVPSSSDSIEDSEPEDAMSSVPTRSRSHQSDG